MYESVGEVAYCVLECQAFGRSLLLTAWAEVAPEFSTAVKAYMALCLVEVYGSHVIAFVDSLVYFLKHMRNFHLWLERALRRFLFLFHCSNPPARSNMNNQYPS